MILGAYKNAVPPFANVWGDLVRMITDITVNELDTEDIPSSEVTYGTLFVLADVLAQSRFLKNLVNDHLVAAGCKERVGKLKRRLEKVCEYMIGIREILTSAVMPTMLCPVDLINPHCHRIFWMSLASAFLSSSVTGRDNKLFMLVFMPKFA